MSSNSKLTSWKVIDSEVAYASPPYIQVRRQVVQLPDGRVVEPYFRIDLRSWVVMAAVTADLRMVVLRQYRHGIERESLMLPGGLLDSGEDPLAAARRELLEETGFEAEQWESMGQFVPNSNYRCGEMELFLGRIARQVAEPNSGDLEESELLLIPLDELLNEVTKGNVISISSAAAIHMASARLKR